MSKPAPIRSDRNPFQLWTVAACFLSGLVAILPFGGARNGAIDRFLPGYATLWYVGLLVSGTVCLVATLLRKRHTGLLTERIGLVLLTGQLTGYGMAILILQPRVPTGILLVGLAVACLVRIRQAGRELRTLRSAIHAAAAQNEERR